jgi:starch-binding outer membrane protein, SusD/RagB family
MNHILKHYIGLCILLLLLTQSGCTKLVEVNTPITEITGASVYNSDATASAVLTGIYTNLSSSYFPSPGGLTSMSVFPSLSADELSVFGNFNPTYLAYYTNSLTSTNVGSGDFWDNIYQVIYVVNSAIEGLTPSTSLTPAVKQQLLGEAYFIRAFCYFYLVNLYGDVPLVTGIDYSVNGILPRAPKLQVWQQITADLQTAQSLLIANYLDASLLTQTNERVRPTLGAASALLARAFLYQQQWDSAIAASTEVINNKSLYSLDTLNGVFLANSNEAIWQLQPVNAGQNTQDAILFVLPPSGPDGSSFPVYLDTILVNAFEPGDIRRANWVDSVIAGGITYYYPYKYKALPSQPVNNIYPPPTEYEMVLRLAEQYLIRAEAEIEKNDLSGATADLNTIRSRAGLANTTAATQTELLNAIYHERQVELFTEWGHRWLDLKRTGNVTATMSVVTPLKGGSWSDYKQWYPISLHEIQYDPNLVQNSGY